MPALLLDPEIVSTHHLYDRTRAQAERELSVGYQWTDDEGTTYQITRVIIPCEESYHPPPKSGAWRAKIAFRMVAS